MLKATARPHPDLRLQLKLGYAAEESEETYLGLTKQTFSVRHTVDTVPVVWV